MKKILKLAVSQFEIKCYWAPAIFYLSQAIYEAHYPEILYRAIFINCPQYFGMIITMLKPVIAPKTLGKIICYAKMSEWQNDMKDLLDPAQFPERYGGSKISEASKN